MRGFLKGRLLKTISHVIFVEEPSRKFNLIKFNEPVFASLKNFHYWNYSGGPHSILGQSQRKFRDVNNLNKFLNKAHNQTSKTWHSYIFLFDYHILPWNYRTSHLVSVEFFIELATSEQRVHTSTNLGRHRSSL